MDYTLKMSLDEGVLVRALLKEHREKIVTIMQDVQPSDAIPKELSDELTYVDNLLMKMR